MNITGLSHAAIKCSDYEASLKFYRDSLGLKEKETRYDSNGEVMCTYLEVTPGVLVELIPASPDEKPESGFSDSFYHICLLVEDIEAAAHELESKGVDPCIGITPAPKPFKKRLCKAGEYNFFVFGPDGMAIEYMQYEEPTTLMTMTDEQLAALEEKLKTDTYIA